MASVGGTVAASLAGHQAESAEAPTPAQTAANAVHGRIAISPGALLRYRDCTVCPMSSTAPTARTLPVARPSAVPTIPNRSPSARKPARTIPRGMPSARATPIIVLRRTTETDTVL